MSAEDHLGRQFDDIIGRNFSPEEEAAMSTPKFDMSSRSRTAYAGGRLSKRDAERKRKHLGHGDTFKVDKWDVMGSNAKNRIVKAIWPEAPTKNYYLP
jgi:hypothetical protein